MQIDGKIAVVTGASNGLGAAIAYALVKAGAIVYGLARNNEALQNLKLELQPNFYPVMMDITRQSAVNYWVEQTFNNERLPDILINNAGVGHFGKLDKMPSEDWLNMINTNLNGMYYITAALVPALKKNQRITHIINIGSILGSSGYAGGAAYCTTKYGVQGFSDALMLELRNDNIKVSCINPGSIATGFFHKSGIESHQNMLHCDQLADTIIHVLNTPDNMLISEMTIRPLNPKKP